MRIVFAGLPLGALLLHHDGHDIAYAAICRAGAIGTRRLAKRLGAANVAQAPDLAAPETVARIAGARADLLVSWFWTKKIPPAVLAIPRFGALGVHPSLLPRHRGPDPYFWAIDAGDRETGVTAHRLERDYDTGDIYAQRALAIDPSWNAWTLAKRLDRPSLALLREVVSAFARGEPPRAEPQDEARATPAPEPSEEDLTIRWSDAAARIERRVRAASPVGMMTAIGDAEVMVTRARVTRDFPRALLPGEAAVVGGIAVVRAADLAIELLEGERDGAGGEVAALGPHDFARLVENARG